VQSEVQKEVEEIVKFADESPNPKAEELYRYLYAGEWEPSNA
jgi:TPP-dependent pyruvate/acetoin dehydrogenase alpha subunit